MAIVSNTSSEIGDVIRIQTDVPAVGIFTLTTFADSTTNETATRYFDKYFRYSVDGGLNWSAWSELTTINIQSIEVRRKDLFILEYRYTRAGSDTTDILAVTSVTVSGESEQLESPNFGRQFFFRFFDINDVNVLGWALNVLEKLYKNGILPDYITRNEDEYNPAIDDADFLAYWGTITHFFAIFVYYARQFENITTTPELIYQFLDNLGIFLNTNITDIHLQYLINNYIQEYENRGTSKITNRGDVNAPNGELLRMITFIEPDEFLLSLLEPHATGWCVSKSSPTFNYTRHCQNLIKGYEINSGFTSLDNYPTTTISNMSISDSKLGITTIVGSMVGIYPDNNGTLIEVDDLVDYELIVELEQENIYNDLYFGVLFYTDNGTQVTGTTLFDLSDSDMFFESKSLYKEDTKYVIRGILHNKNFDKASILTDKFKLNIGYGYDLKFNEGFTTRYILPVFYTIGLTGVNVVTIHDFKIRPLKFNFTLGKLGLKNILYMLYRNNSTYTQNDIYRNTKNKLIPYNYSLIDNEITN